MQTSFSLASLCMRLAAVTTSSLCLYTSNISAIQNCPNHLPKTIEIFALRNIYKPIITKYLCNFYCLCKVIYRGLSADIDNLMNCKILNFHVSPSLILDSSVI